ncbi:PREDICTED: uncharacterized protein LOC104735584 [Camelina sativa]|uniref:Uncharacterized protein LOC104735584 n=1 Tax=Camelina sativa TaxID=90675 RepID=A0ABM0VBE0_CAMSA|nr:PREDICTED: uncharacterized protein LOC104735584 [Camelina sativa]
MSSDASFQIYHNGKFNVSGSGVVTYDGGEILESQPESMLENLVDSLKLSLSEHRIWFKLPFESLSDLKMICNGTDGVERMCIAANYTKAVDIFLEKNMEKEGAIEDNIANGEGDDKRACGEGDECGHVEGCGDEDEVYNSEGTPPHSDCEDDHQHVRYKKGSGPNKSIKSAVTSLSSNSTKSSITTCSSKLSITNTSTIKHDGSYFRRFFFIEFQI